MSLVDLITLGLRAPGGGKIACNPQRASRKNYAKEAAIIHPVP
jgi:hypothetical protein